MGRAEPTHCQTPEGEGHHTQDKECNGQGIYIIIYYYIIIQLSYRYMRWN